MAWAGANALFCATLFFDTSPFRGSELMGSTDVRIIISSIIYFIHSSFPRYAALREGNRRREQEVVATSDGTPVRSEVTVVIRFILRDSSRGKRMDCGTILHARTVTCNKSMNYFYFIDCREREARLELVVVAVVVANELGTHFLNAFIPHATHENPDSDIRKTGKPFPFCLLMRGS
eukprot:gene6311-4541_t